ncbi:MAG: nuclear transport factor 2 family protein [Terracidiphilus sp.]
MTGCGLRAIARAAAWAAFLAVGTGSLVAKTPAGLAALQSAKMPKDQRHESRRTIDQLEQDWRDAVLNRNAKEMNMLLADDYTAITPNGTLQTKGETVNNLLSGRARFTTLEVSDRRVRFYGKTAVVTSRADVQGTTPEGRLSGSYRYTRVYVQDSRGEWKIVSFEASRIRPPLEQP